MLDDKTAPREHTCPFVGLRPYRFSDSHLFVGRESELLAAAHAIGSIAVDRIFVVTGSPGSGKTSFIQASLLPHLHTSARSSYASVDLAAAHDLRAHCARRLLSFTAQKHSNRLANRLADLMIVDPASAAGILRDLLRADLPTTAPPTPIAIEHLERLLSKDEADLLPGGTPGQPRAGRNVLATLVELARLPDIIVLASARAYLFQKVTTLAADASTLFEFPLAPVTSRPALKDILHVRGDHPRATRPVGSTENLRRSAVDLVSRFPSVLPFVTSLFARFHMADSSAPKVTLSPDRLLLEVMADHADAALASLRQNVDSGFNPLFRLLFPNILDSSTSPDSPVSPAAVPLADIGAEWEIRRAAMVLVGSGILTIRDRQGKGACLEATFPSFLSRWRFSSTWISRARSYTRATKEVEEVASTWKKSGRRRHLLLAPGRLQNIAAQIVSEDPDRLSPDAIAFVNLSIDRRNSTARSHRRDSRRTGTTPLTATLAAAACILIGFFVSQSPIRPISLSAPTSPSGVPGFDTVDSTLQPVSFTPEIEDDAPRLRSKISSPFLAHPHRSLPVSKSQEIPSADLLQSEYASSAGTEDSLLSSLPVEPLSLDGCDPVP